MAPVDVSILVVTHNHAEEIDACLDAALGQAGENLSVEVVVVDNASTDGTADRITARGDVVRLERSEHNLGFAAGMNRAYAAASGEHVLLLNPDCVMDDGCVAALRAHLEADPVTALAAALLRDPDGSPQLFARRDLDLAVALWAFTDVGRRIDQRWRSGRGRAWRRYEAQWPPQQPLEVYCPAAACVMAARGELEPRPFDEAFPLFFNDGELCTRLHRRGRRIQIVPAAGAVHGYGTSIQRAEEADLARVRAEWVASLRRYTARFWSRPARAALWAMLVADAAAGAALHVAGRRADPRFVRGTLGGLGLPGGPPPLLTRLEDDAP